MNLFLLDLTKHMDKIEIIPENLEKFKAVFTEKFIFLDSFAFLSSSLDKLAKNSSNRVTISSIDLKENFQITTVCFPTKGYISMIMQVHMMCFQKRSSPKKMNFTAS